LHSLDLKVSSNEGFHLCRFAKELGDFSHHYFPSLDDEAETFLLMRDLFDRVKKAERRVC
jgi:hypothetical protein